MDPKTILITFTTRFRDDGVKAARRAFSNFMPGSGKLASGFNAIRDGITGVVGKLNIFNTLFGRVTGGMLTWQAWRTVVDGFNFIADAIVGGNIKMQEAQNTFTALAGGSSEMGSQFVEVIRQMALQTGLSVDSLLENARRLPTQVGQNFQAFENLMKNAIVLGFIDPAQGAEGAMIALTNALEGTAAGFRSLRERFEIGTMSQINRILEETSNPLEAINRLLEESGINADEFINNQMNSLGVAGKGIINIIREFLRVLGEPVIGKFTEDVIALRDWFIENQAAIQGLAKAIGDRLLGIFMKLREFIKEVFFGGEDLSAGTIFQGLINAASTFLEFMFNLVKTVLRLITSLVSAIASLFGGSEVQADGFEQESKKATDSMSEVGETAKDTADDTTKAMEETTQAANQMAEEVTESSKKAAHSLGEVKSTLLGIAEGGRHTIENIVSGMIEGLSKAQLEDLKETILNNVINLEAQVAQQEEWIKNLEGWVDEAAKEVEAAKDRLKLFDMATEDIPERFTRERRRQLELEVMRAEKEQDRREEALKAAKEQLEVTKEILRAQEQVLSLVERAASAAKDEDVAGGIDKGFVAPSFDTSEFDKEVEKFRQKFAQQIDPLFDQFEEGLAEIGQFVRGLFGAEGAGEFFELGQQLRESLTKIGSGVEGLIEKIKGLFDSARSNWNSLPDGAKNFLLWAMGIIFAPRVTLAIAVTALLTDPSNIMAWLASAGALLGPTGIASVIKITIQLGAKLVGFLASLAPGAASALFGFLGGASLAALALPAATLILAAEIYFGRVELSRWISGERQHQTILILKVIGAEILNNIVEFFGGSDKTFTFDLGGGFTTDDIDLGAGGIIGDLVDETKKRVSDVSNAVKETIFNPFTDWATQTKDEIVGNSIIPDMLDAILGLMTDFPGRLMDPLETLKDTMNNQMSEIKEDWASDWAEMIETAQDAMATLAEMQAAAMSQMAGMTAGAGQQAGAGAGAGPVNVDIKMDADETKQFMEDGVYSGIIDAFPQETP